MKINREGYNLIGINSKLVMNFRLNYLSYEDNKSYYKKYRNKFLEKNKINIEIILNKI